jgi:hypothetical protein
MYSYTDTGVAHAELLLVTCLKRKTLRGIKTFSHQCVFCSVPCSLQYLKTEPKLVLCWGEGEERAIERALQRGWREEGEVMKMGRKRWNGLMLK